MADPGIVQKGGRLGSLDPGPLFGTRSRRTVLQCSPGQKATHHPHYSRPGPQPEPALPPPPRFKLLAAKLLAARLGCMAAGCKLPPARCTAARHDTEYRAYWQKCSEQALRRPSSSILQHECVDKRIIQIIFRLKSTNCSSCIGTSFQKS